VWLERKPRVRDMASNGDVVGGGDTAMGLGSRCRCPADWSRLGYMAGSRSRMAGGIDSWKSRIKSRAGGGRTICCPSLCFYIPPDRRETSEKKGVAVAGDLNRSPDPE